MATSQEMITLMQRVKSDPTQMQAVILEMCDQVSQGTIRVVDATNPFSFMIETTAAMGVAILNEIPIAERRMYKSLAQTPADLYYHMADRDFLNIFATPAYTNMKVLLNVESIYKYAVPVSPDSSVRKLTFPKHTEFKVASVEFTMQYPVDIVVMENNSISVHYDLSEEVGIIDAKLHTIKQQIRYNGNQRYLEVTIPTVQAKLNSYTAKLNASTQFTRSYAFKDKFCYCRAYLKDDNDSAWSEISVTHNPSVYDVSRPTVCISVTAGNVEVTIPQIYFTNGLIEDSVRIDIYTTRGPIEMVMSNFVPGKAYSATWRDLDTIKTSPYAAPLDIFPDYLIYSDEVVVGGNNGIPFNKLRDQTIRGRRDRDGKIITESQLETAVNDRNYDLILDIDNITDRTYLASREIIAPSDGSTSTGAGCMVATLSTDMSKLYLHESVRDHNYRITMLPNTLYQISNGILSIVDSGITSALREMAYNSPDALANQVNSGNYLFTPFHYIMDITTETFDTRAYYMTNPKIRSAYYFKSNDTIGIVASINAYEIVYKEDGSGYRLAVSYEGSSSFMKLDPEQIHVQLHYKGTAGQVVINGVFASTIDTDTQRPVNGQYIYIFDIETSFDIDKSDELILANGATVELNTEFDIVIGVQEYIPQGAVTSTIDHVFLPSALPAYNAGSTYYGFMHEKIQIDFGHRLKGLWTRSRTVNDSERWLKYSENIQARYDKTEFDRDEFGYIKFDEKQQPIVKYNKGDLKVTADGTPVYDHYKGDVVYDEFGDPVVEGGARAMLRQFDLVLFDGIYYFANAASTQSYLKTAMEALSTWVNDDIPMLSDELINRTNLYFYPKTTIGNISIYNGKESLEVSAYQNLKVYYHMRSDRFRNTEIRNTIIQSTGRVVTEVLKGRTISKDSIIEALRNEMKDDVISIEIDGFMNNEYSIVTLSDNSMSPSIGKRLIVDTDATLMVEDSLSVEFIEQSFA